MDQPIITDFMVKQYPSKELKLLNQNLDLQKNLLKKLGAAVVNENERQYLNSFVYDGFYPYYTYQKIKILFIGKESLSMNNSYYIEEIYNGIKNNQPRGPESTYTDNKDPFHSKMLYIAYGLNHDCCSYETMPWASEIGQTQFAIQNGVSYAFMNFSKFDNPSGDDFKADTTRINKYCELSAKTCINWHEEQISLLDPDIIISMNIGSYISEIFKKGFWQIFDPEIDAMGIKNEVINLGFLPVKKKNIPILNTYHFSYGRSFKNTFYKPIVTALKQYYKIC